MSSPQLAVRRRMAAPASAAWDALADTTLWARWGPSVRAVDCAEAVVRPGLTGRVRTSVGVRLPFTITTVEPGRAWSWRIGPVPATEHHVAPEGDASCTVSMTVPWWAAPYALVCRVALRRLERLVV